MCASSRSSLQARRLNPQLGRKNRRRFWKLNRFVGRPIWKIRKRWVPCGGIHGASRGEGKEGLRPIGQVAHDAPAHCCNPVSLGFMPYPLSTRFCVVPTMVKYRTPALCLLLLLAAQSSLVAQTKAYGSPPTATNKEGNTWNVFPFMSQTKRRYMQIHSDLPMTPMNIRAIGFRLEQTSATYTGVRSLELELFMGQSRSYDACSFYYDQNWYPNTRTQVIKRKKVKCLPWTWGERGRSRSLFRTGSASKLLVPARGLRCA